MALLESQAAVVSVDQPSLLIRVSRHWPNQSEGVRACAPPSQQSPTHAVSR